VLDGVPQGEDTTLALCLISDVRVLLAHTNHDTALLSDLPLNSLDVLGIRIPMVARSADNGSWDDVSWRAQSTRGFWQYSRKTARGASSPAKPALHIPEL
jgi:hypothetical protein